MLELSQDGMSREEILPAEDNHVDYAANESPKEMQSFAARLHHCDVVKCRNVQTVHVE
jgi:hypothetical protein